MATAYAMGRPLASGPLRRQEEAWPCGKCIHVPSSNRMTATMTHWNHQANLYHRRASTVQTIMEEQSNQMRTELRTGLRTERRTDVWTSPEPPDPGSPPARDSQPQPLTGGMQPGAPAD